MKRRLPQIICGLFGVVLFALYFSSQPDARAAYLFVLNEYWQIIFAFALMVGAASFARVNLKQIERRDSVPYRVVSLIGFAAMPILALIWGIKGGSPFMWVFDNIQVPMQATVFALLAFFRGISIVPRVPRPLSPGGRFVDLRASYAVGAFRYRRDRRRLPARGG